MGHHILEWTNARGIRQRVQLTQPEIVIGRRADSDIVIPHSAISRQHAKLVVEPQGVSVIDMDSRHGVYVNGKKVQREILRPGDTISLGHKQAELTILEEDALDDAGRQAPIETLEETLRSLSKTIPSRSTPDSELGKLSLLLDFEYHWQQQFSPEDTFRQILRNALRISGAERGYILRRRSASFEYAVGLDHKLKNLGEDDFRTSRTVVRKVAESLEPVFMTEGLSEEFAGEASIVSMRMRAVACLPLIGIASDEESRGVLGILYLDSRNPMQALSGLDEKILRKLASEAGNVLEKLAMIRDIEEKKTLEKELAMARATQVHLLPAEVPELDAFAVRAFCKPTRHVGGDFYDFVSMDGRLIAMLADVSGKGIPASLLSASLQGALQLQLRSGRHPREALEEVNRYLCERTAGDRFATLFMASLESTGAGVFLSAGHIPAYLYRARTGDVEELATAELILGAFDTARYTAPAFEMQAGDVLLIVSDGVTEAHDPHDEIFGDSRLIEVMRQNGARGVELLESRILEELERFTAGTAQSDDITFVLVECRNV